MTTRKIAFVTDDGQTISKHFGRAPYYQVLTVEGERVLAGEQRAKPGHQTFAQGGRAHSHEHEHGFGAAAQDKHNRMIDVIADCEALIAGGMGRGAYLSLQEAGITAIITDLDDIGEAAAAYLRGELENRLDKLH